MPDISMVALNLPTRSADNGASKAFLPLLDGVAMTSTASQHALLHSTFTTLHFLNSSASSHCPATPSSYDHSPPLDLYPSKANTSRHRIKTPVMHPNLVCTLKSILSPKLDFNSQSFTHSATKLQASFQERISSLPTETSSSKPGSSLESTSWPNMQESVLVPVDLIQNRRPYQCAFAGCERTFKNPQTMRMHHKTHFTDAAAAKLGAEALVVVPGGNPLKAGHNKKIPSRCPTCYKTFVGLYELRRHFGRKHSEGEKRHACSKCGKRFHIEVDVRDHEKLCGEPIACSCGMKFAFKCNLVAHKRSHPMCQDPPPITEPSQLSKRRKLSETSGQSRCLPVKGVFEGVPAMLQAQLSPVQPFGVLESASAESSSPFSSTTSSPSTSFVAEVLPEFDVSSSSSLDYHYSSLSPGLFQADSYIKFPLDHYFLAYQGVPQRGGAQ